MYAETHFVLGADFNFNPYLIDQVKDRAFDQVPVNNSLLLISNDKHQEGIQTTKVVTVDGILLSRREKQKYISMQIIPDLFSKLKREYCLLINRMQEECVTLEHATRKPSFSLRLSLFIVVTCQDVAPLLFY